MNKGSINTDYKIVINGFLMLMPHAIYCSNYGVSLSALCLYGQMQNNSGENIQ
jgi:hypothetical protein